MKLQVLISVILMVSLIKCGDSHDSEARAEVALRIATYNIEDIRTTDLTGDPKARLVEAAKIIQHLRPDILLINEMSYDMSGVPGYDEQVGPGHNAMRFSQKYLSARWSDTLQPVKYSAWMPPTNTGISSGFDLDNDGVAVTSFPPVSESDAEGSPPRQTAEGRAFGNDSWGFGTFPGQYGMALFVREGLTIDSANIQTFQTVRWASLDSAAVPHTLEGEPWYDDAEWANMRLSSKNHSIIPVILPNQTTVEILASHPTPPAFDGPELRNKKRNHDEIRLLSQLIAADSSLRSDQGSIPRIRPSSMFVVMGDLNADIDEGNAYRNPMKKFIFDNPRLNTSFAPVASDSMIAAYPDLDPDDTAGWGLRADYVIPSANLTVQSSGVYRPHPDATVSVSDHFPVWIDIVVPANTHE